MSIHLLLSSLRRNREEQYKEEKHYTFTAYTNINSEIYKYNHTVSSCDSPKEKLQKKEDARSKAEPVSYDILREFDNKGIAQDMHTGHRIPMEKINDIWNVLEGFET